MPAIIWRTSVAIAPKRYTAYAIKQADSSLRLHYAHTNFGLTEAPVAAAGTTGRTWEDVSAERLYRPLGMRLTSSRFADFVASHAPGIVNT